jgi:hypothetical protein
LNSIVFEGPISHLHCLMRMRYRKTRHWIAVAPKVVLGLSRIGVFVACTGLGRLSGWARAVITACWRDAAPCRFEAQQRDSGLETPHPRASANWRLRHTPAQRLGGQLDSVRPDASVLPEALRATIQRAPRPVRLRFVSTAAGLKDEILFPLPVLAHHLPPKMEPKWKCKAGETTRFPIVSPTPQVFPCEGKGCLHWPQLDPSRQSPVPLWAPWDSVSGYLLNCACSRGGIRTVRAD